MGAGVRKFTYDRVYTTDGRVLTVEDEQRLSFRPEEVAEARKEAYAEGERSTVAQAEQAAAAALATIAQQLQAIRGGLDKVASELRRDAVELGLAGARAAAETAIARFPEAELSALFDECLEVLRGAPAVVAHAPEPACEAVRARLTAMAEQAGLDTAIKVEAGSAPARLEWASGSAAVDPELALARAREAAERWLAAADENADQLNLFAES